MSVSIDRENGRGSSLHASRKSVATIAIVTVVFFLIHCVVANLVPLVEDETYYTLWASQPALGYYDHPGMIAWWIALGTNALGTSEFSVRLLSVVAYAIVTLMTARMAWLLFGEHAAVWAAVFFNASALVFAMGFVASPDAPSLLFWTGSIWAICEWKETRNPWWWLLAGLCLGLGVQSKFTNLFLGVGVALWILISADGRRALRTWQAWCGAAIAFLVIAPLVWWNIANDFVGLELQFGRIGRGEFNPVATLELLLLVIVGISPLTIWLAASGIRRQGLTLPLILALPFMAYMVYHSFTNHIPMNWLTPLYPAIAILAGAAAVNAPRWLPVLATALGLTLGTVPLVYVLYHHTPAIPGHIPLNQVRGWPQALADLRSTEAFSNARWIATAEYGLTGLLSWHFRDEYPVWAVNEPRRYLFRGDLPDEICQLPGVLVEQGTARDGAEQVIRRSGETPLFSMRVRAIAPGEFCPQEPTEVP